MQAKAELRMLKERERERERESHLLRQSASVDRLGSARRETAAMVGSPYVLDLKLQQNAESAVALIQEANI